MLSRIIPCPDLHWEMKGIEDFRSRSKELIADAEEGLAYFTIFLLLVDEFIHWVKGFRGCAVHVVPPVANEVLLVENGSIGAQK